MPKYLFILSRGSSQEENFSAMFRDINHEPLLKPMETKKVHHQNNEEFA